MIRDAEWFINRIESESVYSNINLIFAFVNLNGVAQLKIPYFELRIVRKNSTKFYISFRLICQFNFYQMHEMSTTCKTSILTLNLGSSLLCLKVNAWMNPHHGIWALNKLTIWLHRIFYCVYVSLFHKVHRTLFLACSEWFQINGYVGIILSENIGIIRMDSLTHTWTQSTVKISKKQKRQRRRKPCTHCILW